MADHDVVVVGGGGAGLRAAIAIVQAQPRLSVAVVSKVYPMRSHTVSAEGGAAAVIANDDSLDEHAYDTVSGSDWLCDQDAVEAFVQEAPRELLQLEHWGCPWSRQPDGQIAVRPFGGMKKMRTWFAADKTGFHLLHTLFQTSLQFPQIARYDEWYVTTLLVDDGVVRGAVGIELATGRIEAITGRAVVLCTGGCGRVFPFTTNGNIKTGDGMALAYRAGAPLTELIPVRPVQHYMMGGVHTDIHGATGLPGLFAAGEVACVSINGSNRLGSNSLPECLVFGRRAGIAAAEYAAAHGGRPGPNVEAQLADERRRLEHDLLARRNGRERIADVRTDMQHTMEGSVGIFRDTVSLVKGVEKLQELRERFDKATLEDTSRTFNTELVAALELGFMLDVAETMVARHLVGKDTRGAPRLPGSPRRDDTRFLAHSLVTRDPGGAPHVEYLPVTITRWPPGERVYGR